VFGSKERAVAMELSSEAKENLWNHYDNKIEQDALHDKKKRGESNRWRLLPGVNLVSGTHSVLSRWVSEKDVGIFITINPENGPVTDVLKSQLSERLRPHRSDLETELGAKWSFRSKFLLGKELKTNPIDPACREEAARWILKETLRYTDALRKRFIA